MLSLWHHSARLTWRLILLPLLRAVAEPSCPEDATVISCAGWCAAVVPDSRATMGGSSCARLSAKDIQRGMGPLCTCYDSSYSRELRTCRSPCPQDQGETATTFSEEVGRCFGVAGSDTCRADQLTGQTSRRYLLYDVKQGEGFNLQREIFPRVGWVVSKVNEGLRSACARGQKCAEWALVLPPWCRLAHWRKSSSAHVPWERFFDAAALRSANVTIMEFYEFVKEAGGPRVDLVISTTTERQPRNQMLTKPRKSGGFYGFTYGPEKCFNGQRGSLPSPRQEWLPEDLRWEVAYSGSCDGGVAAIDHRCAVLADSSSRDFVDLVLVAMREGARSVLLKAADSISPPDKGEMDALGLRQAMLFAPSIRDAGEKYMKDVLDGRPFLAVHCRRTDFLRVREATTPTPHAIAEQVDFALADYSLDKVYVATDAPNDLRSELRSRVRRGTVYFLEDQPRLVSESSGFLEGELAAIEMWIAARATAFVGTQESRFTMHIQVERGLLGKSLESSNRELCKALSGKRCFAPYYRSSGQKGAQHREYWEVSA